MMMIMMNMKKHSSKMINLSQLIIALLLFRPVVAPVPRCSPWLIINKLPESNSLTSDMNPYFPVPPCEYGGPAAALAAGDYDAVLINPLDVPYHTMHELVWLATKLPARLNRMLAGEEEFIQDSDILTEGYSYDKEQEGKFRTRQFGQATSRDASLIDDRQKFKETVQKLISEEQRKRRK
eukprot:GFUD01011203.1.p1 GENE.GFUD01011203.1~~GFUD01011203.1.p1  ORF type:complete len:180 (-),score=34.60 GFUD01011203.1:48-587(-)